MDLEAARSKILGFGMQLLQGIDPNPDNFVCAGIVHMRSQQVGCLLRLEPNKNAQVFVYFSNNTFISIYLWIVYNFNYFFLMKKVLQRLQRIFFM